MADFAAAQVTLHRIRSFIIALALGVVTLHPLSVQANSQLGTVWATRLNIEAITATMGDLTGDGQLELIVASTDRVYIYTWDAGEQRYVEYINVGSFPAPIAAIVTADVTGAGRAELWVGMQGSGSIQRYSLLGPSLMGRGSVGRLWSSVAQLIPVDVDQDGRLDLLALSDEGVALLLRNTGDTFQEVWRTPAEELPTRYLAAGPYFGPGLPAVITAKDQGPVSIYQWGESPSTPMSIAGGRISKRYENYPWGMIGALELLPTTEAGVGKADLFIATSQNLLYRYAWEATGSRHADQWPQNVVNTTNNLRAMHVPGVESQLWLGLEGGSLKAWDLDASGFQFEWQLPEETAWFERAQTGHLITFSTDRYLRVVGPVDSDFLRVERAGTSHLLQHPAVFDDGEVFLSAPDIARILSLRAWSTRNGSRFNGVASIFQFFIIDVGSATASINGRTKQLSAAPRLVEGNMYIPLSFAQALGFSYEWFAPLRHLTFK